MTIGCVRPVTSSDALNLPHFGNCAECAKRFGDEYFTELSMGMSDDFEIAIQEGATMIRVGSAIDRGRRQYDSAQRRQKVYEYHPPGVCDCA